MSQVRWEPILDYPNYAVSNKGDVWSFRSNRWLKGYVRNNRRSVYLYNDEGQRAWFVSRLVARAFVPGETPERWSVNHIDGNPRNDVAENLEWCSLSDQHRHLRRNSLHRRGESHASSRLSDDDVRAIVLECTQGKPQAEVAAKYGICQSQVSSIVLGKVWSHVTGVKRNRTRKKVTAEIASFIMSSDLSPKEISVKTGVPLSTVYRIRRGGVTRTKRPTLEGEEWASIEGYPNYQVSSHGRVWSDFTSRLLQASTSNRGIYVQVALSDGQRKKYIYVHRLVAESFVSGRSALKEVVDHKDGNGVNNHKDNLEWVSQKENLRRAKDRTRN